MPPARSIAVCAFGRGDACTLGLTTYRALWPLEALAQRPDFGPCRFISQAEVREAMRTGRYAALTENYDLYVIQRLVAPDTAGAAEFFGRLRANGAKIVFETDDDLTDEHRWVGYGEWLEQTLAHVDAITVSTPALARRMERYGKPIYVAVNRIKTGWFAEVSLQAERLFKEQLVVGLVGTRTHWGDWHRVLDALKRIQREYPDVVIAVAGYNPPYFRCLGKQLVEFAGVPFEIYPAIIRQFDIRLCPLDPADPFNAAKSAVAALEAMAGARPVGKRLGGAIPVVQRGVKHYQRVVAHRHNGIVVRDEDWYSALAELIEDHALRRKLSVNGLRWVRRHRDIGNAAEWAAAYKQILAS